jgi:hypothetical protein
VKPFAQALDRWFGRGEASITTPPMDGAFRPNDLLDAADVALEAPKPDALAVTTQGLLVSLGRSLTRVDKLENETVASFDAEISALTGLPDGGAAAALIDGRIVFIGGRNDGKTIAGPPCMTAFAPARDGALFIAGGSTAHGPADWKRDLMEKGASGSVWRLDIATGGRTQIAGDLAYPYGLIDEGDSVVVAESWRSALTRIFRGASQRTAPVLEGLPAYPARMSRAADGSIWLALFCAAQAARRVRADRRPLPPAHDRGNRSGLLAGARPSRRPVAARANPAGRRPAARRAEAVVAEPVLRARGASRRRLSSGRQLPQPGERSPARRHVLPRVRAMRLFRRQGRRRRRFVR